MKTMRILLILSMLSFVPALVSVRPATAAPAVITRVRVGVTADGITKITPANLQALGITGVDPRTFSLTSLGSPVAILVTGEADGQFTGSDQLLFFGEKYRGVEMDQKYTDERVYWLEMGGTAGPRISSVAAAPANTTPLTSVLTTLRAEQNNLWWTLHSIYVDTEDTWHWASIKTPATLGASAYADLPFTVPYPASGATATLRVTLMARDNGAKTNLNHQTTVALNGTSFGAESWAGYYTDPVTTYTRKTLKTHTAAVPAGVLAGDTATVRVTSTNVAAIDDNIYANYWELDYRREFRAWQGVLDFKAESAGTRDYLVRGFATNAIGVWDVTTATAPQQYTGGVISSPAAGEYQVRFNSADAVGKRFWLQQTDTYQAPASLRVRPATGLRAPAGGADTVIVTHTSLLPAAEALATWHRNHGRRTLLVNVEDIYDEFNDGIFHPKAIRAMMTWAKDNWAAPAPTYLTLVGDGHWNFKAFNTASYPAPTIMIPPYLAWVDPDQGEVPAEMLFGELTGDFSPDLAVGRLPVATLADAWIVVNKIVTYDENMRLQPWQRRELLIADNDEEGLDFGLLLDQVLPYIPADIASQKVYLGETHADAASATAAIRSDINAGVLMVQYNGHGAPTRWAHEPLWATSDVTTLTNGSMLPVVISFNCLDGYFVLPMADQTSMVEVMLTRAGGGSVAAISPTSLGYPFMQRMLRNKLMDVMFTQNVRELGRALMLAKQQYIAAGRSETLTYTQSLFGDPAMRLPAVVLAVPQSPQVGVARSGQSVTLSWPAVTQDIFNQTTTVTNYTVWRGTQPYYDPAQDGCPCETATVTSNLSWTDLNRIGDPAVNHFWVVTAANTQGSSHISNRTGEFDFALVRGQ